MTPRMLLFTDLLRRIQVRKNLDARLQASSYFPRWSKRACFWAGNMARAYSSFVEMLRAITTSSRPHSAFNSVFNLYPSSSYVTEQALADFQRAYGWKVGIDGSIVVVTLGAAGSIDTDSLTSPIVAFVTDQEGLMYSLSLEGSKISRIAR
jgi:hypothetical protein